MNPLCNTLNGYTNPTCFSNVTVAGVTGRVVVIPADVYRRMVITQDADGVITNLALGTTSGDQGYLYQLPRNNPKPSSPSTKGADGGGFTHTVPIVIPKLTQDTKNWVASLVNRNLCVVLVENLDGIAQSGAADGRAYWELYGFQSMLENSVSDSQRANQDNGNGIMLTLTTPTDTTLEYALPLNVNDGVSRDTTDAIVIALMTPVS